MNIQKLVAQIVGGVLALVGVIGFFTGAALLVFGVNGLHNSVHLLTGLLGLAAGFVAAGKWSALYNKSAGVVYLLVTGFGFVAPALALSLLAINSADNFLHLVLGVVLAGVGFFGDRLT